jgi:alanine-synthesizing transaminase
MMVLGFPSNPTAQCVELDFFERVIALAKKHEILVVHDLAYADIVFDGWKAPSIMQVPGAKDVAVEFFTLSKSYNMAGWRIGFMVGNADLVACAGAHQELPRLRQLHARAGGGHRGAGRRPAVREGHRATYQKRRDVLVKGLREAGWAVDARRPACTSGRPSRRTTAHLGSLEFAKQLLAKAKVSVSPGIGFGDHGDDHVRFALIENESRIRQAVRGIKAMFKADGVAA